MSTSYDIARIAEAISESKTLCGSVRVIAIDGPAGSGKTTLASQIAKQLGDVQIVHMDDLYKGWSQDLVTDLPNKIERQILKPIKDGGQASYQKYDWHENKFTQTVIIPKCNFLILEGVGAANPKLSANFAISIWIEADADVRFERVIARDGEQIRAQMITWKLKEQSYFRGLEVRQQSDIRLSGD